MPQWYLIKKIIFDQNPLGIRIDLQRRIWQNSYFLPKRELLRCGIVRNNKISQSLIFSGIQIMLIPGIPLRWTGQIRKNADKLLLQGIVAEITYAIRYDHIVRMFQRNQTKHWNITVIASPSADILKGIIDIHFPDIPWTTLGWSRTDRHKGILFILCIWPCGIRVH